MLFSALIEPIGLWQRVAQLLASQPARLLRLLAMGVVLGAFGSASAVYVGTRWFSTDSSMGALGFLPGGAGGVDAFQTTFLGLLIAPFVLAQVYLVLLRVYGLPRRWLAAFAVAVIGALPIYLAGLTLMFVPAILLVVGAFLLSCMWWAVGARQLLAVAPTDSAEFNAIAIVATVVLLQVVGALVAGSL
jgi:hypothetical protein